MKRYGFTYDHLSLVPESDGEWLRFEDVEAMLEKVLFRSSHDGNIESQTIEGHDMAEEAPELRMFFGGDE